MTGRLFGKKAVVTGGSRGIGAAIAKRLAADGADVMITYVGNKASAEDVVATMKSSGVQAGAIQADASKPEAVRAAIIEAADTLGGIDILVHNAGVIEMAPVHQDTGESFTKQFAVNVEAVFIGTLAAVPHLRDGGRLVIIGSVNAHVMPWEGGAIYGATKAAVAGLARGWARDFGSRGILVNVVQPGPIDTDMNPNDDREAATSMRSLTALKRYGRPEEVAAAVAFFASDDASYITGTTLDVDGGLSV